MKVMIVMFVVLVVIPSTGCTSLHKVVRELAKDPATVRLRVVGAGLAMELDRTAPNTNSPPHQIGNGSITVTR